DEIVAAALQETVGGRPEVAHVAEHVVHAAAHRLRRDVGVGLGHRLEQGAVDGVVELVDAAVETFPGVARIGVAGGGAARGHGTHGQGGGESNVGRRLHGGVGPGRAHV